ncbi:MAG: adenine phosphoribosyltransferase [Chitinophagaceae bacterium]
MTLSERIKSAVRTIPDFPKPGIQYKDISTLFLKPDIINDIIIESSDALKTYQIDVIAGIESRGFLLGAAIAAKMQVPFVMIRKAGKLPSATYKESYELEYGSATIEMHCDAISKGSRVAVIDDVLATGGTAMAAFKLIKKAGAEAVLGNFIAELEFLGGRQKIEEAGIEVLSHVKY